METALCIADSGCEAALAEEIGRYIDRETTVHLNCVEVQCTLEEAALLAFQLAIARRVLVQLAPPFSEKIEGAPSLDLEGTFRAEAEVLRMTLEGEALPEQSSQELVETLASWVIGTCKLTVDLTRPDWTIRAVRTPERTYVGLDFAGRSLARREWRAMVSRRSLKSTIAAAAGVYAGLSGEQAILDPAGGDGTLGVEAALMLSRTSPRQHEEGFPFERLVQRPQVEPLRMEPIKVFAQSLKEVKAVRMNSKLAGVDKHVQCTKVAVDWMEFKASEHSFDSIITAPQASGKSLAEAKAHRMLDDLFSQARIVLAKDGTITCITPKPEEVLTAAQTHKFKIVKEMPVLMGMQRLSIITMRP